MPGRRVCRQGRKGGTRGQQLGAIALGQDTDDRGMADSDRSGEGKVVRFCICFEVKLAELSEGLDRECKKEKSTYLQANKGGN